MPLAPSAVSTTRRSPDAHVVCEVVAVFPIAGILRRHRPTSAYCFIRRRTRPQLSPAKLYWVRKLGEDAYGCLTVGTHDESLRSWQEKTQGSHTRRSLDLGHSHVARMAGSAIGETMISGFGDRVIVCSPSWASPSPVASLCNCLMQKTIPLGLLSTDRRWLRWKRRRDKPVDGRGGSMRRACLNRWAAVMLSQAFSDWQ